jgi:hypothetical protein
MTEDKFERIADVASDVVAVIGIATLLAFVASVWREGGFGPAVASFALFFTAYMVGRHHATKAWWRVLPALKAKWERDRSEEP